jgi:hypothetical protein
VTRETKELDHERLLVTVILGSLSERQQQAETSLLACVRRKCSDRDCGSEDELVDSWSPCPSGFGPISAEAGVPFR